MDSIRISELPELAGIESNDDFIVNTNGGTGRMPAGKTLDQLTDTKTLKSLSEIQAVTEAGFIPDALVLKEVSANIPIFRLEGTTLYIDLPETTPEEVG